MFTNYKAGQFVQIGCVRAGDAGFGGDTGGIAGRRREKDYAAPAFQFRGFDGQAGEGVVRDSLLRGWACDGADDNLARRRFGQYRRAFG